MKHHTDVNLNITGVDSVRAMQMARGCEHSGLQRAADIFGGGRVGIKISRMTRLAAGRLLIATERYDVY